MKKSTKSLLAGILIPALLFIIYEIAKRWKSDSEDFIEDVLKPALASAGKKTVGLLLVAVLRRGVLPEKVIDLLTGLSDKDMDDLMKEIASSLRNVL